MGDVCVCTLSVRHHRVCAPAAAAESSGIISGNKSNRSASAESRECADLPLALRRPSQPDASPPPLPPEMPMPPPKHRWLLAADDVADVADDDVEDLLSSSTV